MGHAWRVFVWCLGVLLLLLSVLTAFVGYVLPWGQMSFWGDGDHQPCQRIAGGWQSPRVVAVGFLFLFAVGGLTGVVLAPSTP